MIDSLGAPAGVAAFSRARDLCLQVGDDQELFSALDGLRWSSLFRCEMESARELAEEQLALAKRSGNPDKLALAIGGLGEVMVWRGEFVAARGYIEPLVALSATGDGGQRLHGRALEVRTICLSLLTHVLLDLGFPDQAVKRRKETLAWVSSFPRGYATFVASHIACMAAMRLRSPGEVLELSQRTSEFATEQGLSSGVAMASVFKGWALSCQGRDESAIEQMRAGIEHEEATGIVAPTWLFMPLADAYLRFGRLRECAELVEKMLERTQTGQRWEEADIYRLKGEMLLMQGGSHAADAEQCLRKAVEIARQQSAKFLELRATTSLARLLHKQSKRDVARTMLAEIYNWFTEGFDTADLKNAKALLAELNG